MFVKDIYCCDDIVFDDMNEDIIVTYVSIIVLHIVAVLFYKSIATVNSGVEWLKMFVGP
ncbi:MAG: hypothetical protein JSV25_01265 [Spirochaetota bacterium]|nr:MAG: hypothetical protein JSV25_01265 [Spirochaetota bacterium]